ncbi:MAG TPA: hypothetical protein PK777_15975, partial [Thermoguttaceae bacterium]|nr:hypothetical protein [Thermoguttaceae bacterium]
ALRTAIQKDAQGPQKAAPVGASLAIKPVLAVLAEHGDQVQQEKARQVLEKMSGKDRLRLAVESAEGRLRLRIEIQQDVLAVMALTVLTASGQQ